MLFLQALPCRVNVKGEKSLTNYYTIIGKSVLCPQYNEKLVLSAKYRFTGNPNNEYEVAFTYARCPIIENSKLSKDDQCDEYKYLQCFQPNCKLLKEFPSIWDARKSL